jgi:hypothetical protein
MRSPTGTFFLVWFGGMAVAYESSGKRRSGSPENLTSEKADDCPEANLSIIGMP